MNESKVLHFYVFLPIRMKLQGNLGEDISKDKHDKNFANEKKELQFASFQRFLKIAGGNLFMHLSSFLSCIFLKTLPISLLFSDAQVHLDVDRMAYC